MSGTIETPDVSVRSPIELTSVNTIRTLSMDGVQAANSGAPWNSHGHGAGGILPRAALPARSSMAEPGPLRAVYWACVHAALFAA